MAPGDFDFGGERIVVGVSKDPSCKEAIKWAITNKLRSPEDILILLHVVTKIPSPSMGGFGGNARPGGGAEMYQSEVNNTMFVHYVRTVVQPMMLSLKKMVDPKIKLELKVGRNNSREKGIVEESKKLKATSLVIGTNARGMFSMRGKSSSTGAYCVRYKPNGISVYVIQKDKVVLFKEAEGSPISSSSSSPSGSGAMLPRPGPGSGSLEPTYSGAFSEQGGEYDDGGYAPRPYGSSYGSGGYDQGPDQSQMYGQYPPQQQQQQQQQRGPGQPGWNQYGSPGGGGIYGSSDSSPSGSGVLQPVYSGSSAGGGGSGGMVSGSSRFSMDGGRTEGQWSGGGGGGGPGKGPGGTDIQQAAALSALAWSQTANSKEGQQLQSDYMAEFENWKRSNQAATFQQQQDFMQDLQARMAKARTALAGLHLGEGSPSSGSPGAAGSGEMAPRLTYPAPVPAPVPDTPYSGGGGGGQMGEYESDLRRELEVMRQRASEAEKARLEAEQRAQRALSDADRSLREVEAQNKRRELETAVRIEMASQEAARAMQAAEDARRQAGLEAQKTEVAMKQAAMTKAALELEAKKRVDAEAKSEKSAPRFVANYRLYSYEDIVTATNNFHLDRKLGEGGFGTVYAGTLHHTPVAVKLLKNADACQAASEFQQEVEVLSQIQHPHMVMLLGCCPDKYCLVYEHMANGSLEDRLLCLNNSPPLPWYVRLRVAAEIASALLILHTRPVPIVHRDLKPGNILLDKNLVAKLGDVGLAKLMPGLNMDQTYMRESVPVGTFAYVDPEFQRTGEFGPKSDVYALGIVLLDLLTGRKPNVYEGLEEAVDDGDEQELKGFLDERAGDWPVPICMEIAKIAVKCSEMRRKKRPDLEAQVMPILDKARTVAAKAEEEAKFGHVRTKLAAPSSLFCPITQEMMVDPVLAADGHTYEKLAIESWLETKDMSPMTNQKLPYKDLMPNHAVRAMILDWKERNA